MEPGPQFTAQKKPRLGADEEYVRVRDIQTGDVVRPGWGDLPYQEVTGAPTLDRSHPSSSFDPDEDDEGMFVIPYSRTVSPHIHPDAHYIRKLGPEDTPRKGDYMTRRRTLLHRRSA